MANKTILKGLKLTARVSMILVIIWIAILSGAFYGQYKQGDESYFKFYLEGKSVQYTEDNELPIYWKLQIEEYNKMIKWVWLALGLSSLIMILDYFIDPKNHFITQLKARGKNGG